jgi:Spy/CpxP family protein refolding chaperone
MKSKLIKSIGAVALAAGLTFAYAETPSQGTQPGHRAMNRQAWMQQRFDRLSAYLNLTDAQKTQAQAALKAAHESTANLAPRMKENREAMATAIKANNTSEIDRLAAERGTLMGKMMAAHDEAFAKIYQTLTPEQKVKADQMRQERGQHRRQAADEHR